MTVSGADAQKEANAVHVAASHHAETVIRLGTGFSRVMSDGEVAQLLLTPNQARMLLRAAFSAGYYHAKRRGAR